MKDTPVPTVDLDELIELIVDRLRITLNGHRVEELANAMLPDTYTYLGGLVFTKTTKDEAPKIVKRKQPRLYENAYEQLVYEAWSQGFAIEGVTVKTMLNGNMIDDPVKLEKELAVTYKDVGAWARDALETIEADNCVYEEKGTELELVFEAGEEIPRETICSGLAYAKGPDYYKLDHE